MDDAELIEAVREGRTEAYGHLVERYQGLIFRICYRLTGSVSDAEDLAHDAFVDVYIKLDQLRNPERFPAWLKSIALNLCRIWYRRRQRETVGLPEDLADCREAEADDRSDYGRMFS